jgi:ActR/RegA family two-component response regulator
MSGFSAQWLALREAHDRAARSPAVLDALAAAFAGAPAVAVVDLGCGTGSTMRAIASLLPARQHWRLIDDDEALLACAARAAPSGTYVTTVAADLAQHLERAIGEEPDVVTLSALLDLVSAAWLDRLVAAMVRLGRGFMRRSLGDGEVAMTPAARHDATVIAAVNRHQLTDKGFGPALGPGAARTAPDRFRRNGFVVIEGRSDWRFGNGDGDIQLEMLAGWTAAAGEIGVARSMLDEWLGEHRDHVATGRSRMRVGHVDFFASPTTRR